MSIRGLLGFIIAAQRRLMFNRSDSSPSWLGKNIVQFILSLTEEEYDTMARLVGNITWVDEDSTPSPELQDRYKTAGFAVRTDDWYGLLFKAQGGVALPAIRSGELEHLPPESDGGEGGWAYCIDFENRTLETWAFGDLLGVVTFKQLVKMGDRYMDDEVFQGYME